MKELVILRTVVKVYRTRKVNNNKDRIYNLDIVIPRIVEIICVECIRCDVINEITVRYNVTNNDI